MESYMTAENKGKDALGPRKERFEFKNRILGMG
jgi:hypothetical protein